MRNDYKPASGQVKEKIDPGPSWCVRIISGELSSLIVDVPVFY
jgi:hypothetical protein